MRAARLIVVNFEHQVRHISGRIELSAALEPVEL